ncbi:MAG: hypothetical protein M0Z26_01495 [Acidithiobacillus sp.]|nr:hypothetical protein [Acidithiobacillus sp.]
MMATLRGLAMSITRLTGVKNIAKATRDFAASARKTLRQFGSATESPPQDLSIREMHRRKKHVCRSPNSPLFTENSLKKQHFYHRHTLYHHQNER